jgi:hypothetical protein
VVNRNRRRRRKRRIMRRTRRIIIIIIIRRIQESSILVLDILLGTLFTRILLNLSNRNLLSIHSSRYS